jgi:hypothetical protein
MFLIVARTTFQKLGVCCQSFFKGRVAYCSLYKIGRDGWGLGVVVMLFDVAEQKDIC